MHDMLLACGLVPQDLFTHDGRGEMPEVGDGAVVQIILGSESDQGFLWNSALTEILDGYGVTWHACVYSAHRNLPELTEFIEGSYEETAVYVCAAGMAAALPGAVRAILLRLRPVPILGVALPSKKYRDAQDARIAIEELPPGVEVTFAGVGEEGFNDAAQIVCSNVGLGLPWTEALTQPFTLTPTKPPIPTLKRPTTT